ncbi:hypothetical protein COY23_00375 [bacterium (Candidatus Torokbacteria) CG_4_10_14_0_2_um_filter_35_8]|nr:MAG: hypothetical protein COY23_00375 [bacterium (Candidatus Torokbacteria) CG_4_10_14_0_2_um_filter_35_8]
MNMKENINISFVVIAKNEIFTIHKCISSIIKAGNRANDYEIIYVDSASTDGTLEVVSDINSVKIRVFRITKNPNSAVARNIGIKHTKYDYIFFIDGDVVIKPNFAKSAISEALESDETGIVFGKLKEIQYNDEHKKIIKIVQDREKISKRSYRKSAGGIFLTKKSIIDKVGNFDERLRVNQDWDFAFRVGKKYKILALPEKMGTHHTVTYRDIKRIKNIILSGQRLYLGFLIRKYLLQPGIVFFIIKLVYGVILGGIFWILLIFSFLTSSLLLKLVCVLFIIIDILLGVRKERGNLVGRMVDHYIVPFFILAGFLFYFPKKKEVEWEEVKKESRI